RVRRARPLAASSPRAAPARRPKGGGGVHADLLGRRDRHDRGAVARDRRRGGRRGDPAVLLRGLDGPGAILCGPPPLPRARRLPHPAALHPMVRPGTDAALALAVMHVLITEARVDRDYIERATLGFERLAEHVKAYPPERVAPIVGLDAETIVRFARRYGASPRTFIRIGIGISRHDNGGMPCRTLACLPAVMGARGDRLGGTLLSSGGAFAMDMRALERPD